MNAAPGQLVDEGGYRIHIYCVGRGSPPSFLIPICQTRTLTLRIGPDKRVVQSNGVVALALRTIALFKWFVKITFVEFGAGAARLSE
jgi:hypothetical protein